MIDEQLKLFSVADAPNPYRTERPPSPTLGKDSLLQWKQRLQKFQDKVRLKPPPSQTSLIFETVPKPDHWDAEKIDPFGLPPKPWDFYRERYDPLRESQANIYFVLDHAVPLLLYVGETKLSIKQRWQGVHDCKDYIDAYISLHRQYDLAVAVNLAFNVSVPADRTQRLALERELILKWRSPFNKECWRYWGQPFQRRG